MPPTNDALLARAIIASLQIGLMVLEEVEMRGVNKDLLTRAAKDGLVSAGLVEHGTMKEEAQRVADIFQMGQLYET